MMRSSSMYKTSLVPSLKKNEINCVVYGFDWFDWFFFPFSGVFFNIPGMPFLLSQYGWMLKQHCPNDHVQVYAQLFTAKCPFSCGVLSFIPKHFAEHQS